MALFPCDVGLHRYQGPQRTIYAAIVNGADATRRKLRLCLGHFQGYEQVLLEHTAPAQMDMERPEEPPCCTCGKTVDPILAQFFATVYDQGAERADYWAPVHEDCAAAVAEDWLIGIKTDV